MEPSPARLPLKRSHRLYGASAANRIDALARKRLNLGADQLLQKAGAAAFEFLRLRWPGAQHIQILCGPGNNGGDGFVLGRLLRGAGLKVSLFFPTSLPPRSPREVAAAAAQAFTASGGVIQDLSKFNPEDGDLMVDAIFGTGLKKAPAGIALSVIKSMNRCGKPILALDIASGLSADSGAALGGTAVQADCTLSFICHKKGLWTGQGPGRNIHLAPLDVPDAVLEEVDPDAVAIDEHSFSFSRRQPSWSKHDLGHVLVVGGNRSFGGAAVLAGEAALACGAGLVTVAVHPQSDLPPTSAELMVHRVSSPAALALLLRNCNAVALGPGLGLDAWARGMLTAVFRSGTTTTIVDADALNLVAEIGQDPPPKLPQDLIFTPHAGEAARLLNSKRNQIEADRFGAVNALARLCGGTALLKGRGTLVACNQRPPRLIRAGNPGMAAGGMGDALSGIIASLAAQGPALGIANLFDAASAGAWLHASAGDLAAIETGEAGLSASALIEALPALLP